MINPSAILLEYLSANTDLEQLVGTRIWAERRKPLAGYKPSTGPALLFYQLQGRLDYSSKHLSVPFMFKCYAINDVAAYELYSTLVDALQDAHHAPMYEAALATSGQTMRESPDPSDWSYVQCSFTCHFRMADITAPVAVFFGDSITYGVGASSEALTWRYRVASAKGWTGVNSGWSGTFLQNTVQNTVATIGAAADSNGRDSYISRINGHDAKFVTILYGTNDILFSDAAYTAALYQNDLSEIVAGVISLGIYKHNIIIGSPPYMTGYTTSSSPYNAGSALKHAQYVAAAAAVAAARDTKYIDVYAWMAANGADSLLDPDGVHPNDWGHQEIADAFLSVI